MTYPVGHGEQPQQDAYLWHYTVYPSPTAKRKSNAQQHVIALVPELPSQCLPTGQGPELRGKCQAPRPILHKRRPGAAAGTKLPHLKMHLLHAGGS